MIDDMLLEQKDLLELLRKSEEILKSTRGKTNKTELMSAIKRITPPSCKTTRDH